MSIQSFFADAKYCITMSKALSICEYVCPPGKECIHEGCVCFVRGQNGKNYCALELVLDAIYQEGNGRKGAFK